MLWLWILFIITIIFVIIILWNEEKIKKIGKLFKTLKLDNKLEDNKNFPKIKSHKETKIKEKEQKNKNIEKIEKENEQINAKYEQINAKYDQIIKKYDQIIKWNELCSFQLTFMNTYNSEINSKNKLNEEYNKLRVNYLLLSFSDKVKNLIGLTRIINFRKIVNCLLNHIIDKNKNCLKKTYPKFIDVLKPKDNQRSFYIIYCQKDIEGVKIKEVNIIIDFLVFIHNYTSSIIHLNKIDNYKDIIPNIANNNGDNSVESDSNNSEKKTNVTYHPYELIDYVFTSYDIKKETKELIENLEDEERRNIEIQIKNIENQGNKENQKVNNNIENENEEKNDDQQKEESRDKET